MKTFNENISRILTLVNVVKQIDGRTKFQKIVYVLKNKGIKFNEKFKYHYYGPFSTDLQLEIEELVDRNILIEENSTPYIYKLNHAFEFERSDDIIQNEELIKLLADKDYRDLELTATIYFLENAGYKKDEIIKKKLKKLKPHLKDNFEKAFTLKKQIDERTRT